MDRSMVFIQWFTHVVDEEQGIASRERDECVGGREEGVEGAPEKPMHFSRVLGAGKLGHDQSRLLSSLRKICFSVSHASATKVQCSLDRSLCDIVFGRMLADEKILCFLLDSLRLLLKLRWALWVQTDTQSSKSVNEMRHQNAASRLPSLLHDCSVKRPSV